MKAYNAWRKSLHFYWKLSVATVILCGCSTTLSVQSEPSGAEVFLSQSPNTKKGNPIGKTPLEVDFDTLPLDRGGYLIFELSGYLTESILISEPALGTTSADMFLRLTKGKREGEKASELLGLLASAQEQAKMGTLDLAHSTIDRALEIDGYFVRGVSFKAALFYLDKKYDESEKLYKRALTIDPNFAEATRMLAKIEIAKKGGI